VRALQATTQETGLECSDHETMRAALPLDRASVSTTVSEHVTVRAAIATRSGKSLETVTVRAAIATRLGKSLETV
jgi:hypothetical protein